MKQRAERGLSGVQGVSLLEVLIVITMILVVSAVAIINISSSLQVAAADSAAQLVQQDMRMARQSAISNRLVYSLTFDPPNAILMQQLVATVILVSGVSTPTTIYNNVSNDTIPSTVSFQILSGTPVNPDNFCSCQPSPLVCSCQPPPAGSPLVPTVALDFNGQNPAQIFFYPDGAGRDANGRICNGVVYTSANAGQMSQSRAITVWGSTGQIRLYKLFSNVGGYYWQ
jgi:type II secretory pathway pseudopilin PulG